MAETKRDKWHRPGKTACNGKSAGFSSEDIRKPFNIYTGKDFIIFVLLKAPCRAHQGLVRTGREDKRLDWAAEARQKGRHDCCTGQVCKEMPEQTLEFVQ